MKPVMIIDPSQTVRKILEICLRRAGIESEAYNSSGVEAIQALRQNKGAAPAVIMLEATLPRMGEYEVVLLLRKQGYLYTAIVMLSKRDGVLDRLKGRLAGADDYLTKPFTVKGVLAVVQRYLQQRRCEEEAITPLRDETDRESPV